MKIGWIGLGTMGHAMAENILKAGYTLTVYNRSAEPAQALEAKGAARTLTPRKLVEASDIIFLSLPDSTVVEPLILATDGLIQSLRPGQIVVDTSSSDPESTRKIHSELAQRQVHYIDAPISGGPPGAIAASLTFMLGGDATAVERIRPLLESMGQQIYYLGASGSGHAMKALNNMLLGVSYIATMEALALGRKNGLELEAMLEVINHSSGYNFITQKKLYNSLMQQNFKPGFTVDLFLKDIQTGLQLAKDSAMRLELSEQVPRFYQQMQAEGDGALDYSILARYLEEQYQIEFLPEEK